jgi:hypothetical protein
MPNAHFLTYYNLTIANYGNFGAVALKKDKNVGFFDKKFTLLRSWLTLVLVLQMGPLLHLTSTKSRYF